MLKNMTKWLGVIDNTEEEATVQVSADGGEETEIKRNPEEKTETPTGKESTENPDENDDLISPETKKTLEEASAKAISTAKEWGSYLYTFGKEATKTVTDKAIEISRTVEEKTFLGDFSKEQDKFVCEKKEKSNKSEAAVPPWIGYNEEEVMKTQILALSQDKRNFLRNPPTGTQFPFDFDAIQPVAMATLLEDPNLQKMRFELVPKQVKEEPFWRNYFYRVSLIKQSTQLTTLAQQTGNTGEGKSSDRSRDSSASSDSRERSSPQNVTKQKEEAELVAESPPQDSEFISDTFQTDHLTEEDIKKEMQLLGVEDEEAVEKTEEDGDNLPQWERDLQKELQEYEMVNEDPDMDDLELENELLKQIESETSEAP